MWGRAWGGVGGERTDIGKHKEKMQIGTFGLVCSHTILYHSICIPLSTFSIPSVGIVAHLWVKKKRVRKWCEMWEDGWVGGVVACMREEKKGKRKERRKKNDLRRTACVLVRVCMGDREGGRNEGVGERQKKEGREGVGSDRSTN
jgi:hypothetical protein